MSNNEYTKRLENVIKQMLQPLKDIPFNLVIESMTGKKVIKIDTFYPSSKTCHNEGLRISGMVVPSTQMEAKIRLPRGEAQSCEICSSI